MKLEFEYAEVQNFFSYGNTPTRIDLNKYETTMIVADNGNGKTTLVIDSIFFALFGTPLKKLKKNNMIPNFINRKNCLVTLSFKVDQTHFLVKRGLAPDVFDIEIDGVPFGISLTKPEKQRELMSRIKVTKNVLEQLLFTSGRNPSFMSRTGAERRELVERVLDLGIYAKMNEISKYHVKKLTTKKNEIESSVSEQHSIITKLKEVLDGARVPDLDVIKECKAKIKKIDGVLPKMEKALEELGAMQDKQSTELQSIQSDYTEKQREISRIEKDNEEFKGGVCPTCGQTCEGHEEKSTEELEAALVELVKKRDVILLKTSKIKEKIKEVYDKKNDSLDTKREAEKKLAIEESVSTDHIDDIKTKISEAQELITNLSVEADEVEGELSEYSHIQKSLQRGDAKNSIIEDYLPFFNERVNYYLERMNMPILFELDSEFNETLRSRYRDLASYENFSTGQQSRIDFAVLLTWRDVSSKLASIESNLFVMDEFGAYLDYEGRKIFRNLIKDLEGVNFIGMCPIDMNDAFEKTIHINFRENFSVVE